MSRQLFAYSLVRAFYDKGEDYIDSFWPFALSVMPANRQWTSMTTVKEEIARRYHLQIPEHSLSIIVNRAKRKKLLQVRGEDLRLTEQGEEHATWTEAEADVNRRLNELFEDARAFLRAEKGINLSVEEIEGKIQSLIQSNTGYFLGVLSPNHQNETTTVTEQLTSKEEIALVNYIELVEGQKPAIFKTLKELVYGSIMSTILHGNRLEDIDRKFGVTDVYFDTNILLSLFGFHPEPVNRATRELHTMLRSSECFRLKVFYFTLVELANLLRSCLPSIRCYSVDIEVDSLCSAVRRQGYKAADLIAFIGNLEHEISKLHINVISTGVKLNKKNEVPAEEVSALGRYKEGQPPLGRNHDLIAIRSIKQHRRGTVRQLERAKALFLTSDLRLAKYCLTEEGHEEANTVPEVIPDQILTNVLWLKSPTVNEDLPLRAIIAVHSKRLLIDDDVWIKFHDTVTEMNEGGRLDDLSTGILLYDQRLTDELVHKDPDDIRPEWILTQLRRAKKSIEEAREKALSAQSEEYKSQITEKSQAYEQRIAALEQDAELRERKRVTRESRRQKKLMARIQDLRDDCRKKAGVRVSRWIWGLRVFAVLFVLLGAGTFVLPHWDVFEPIAWTVGFIVLLLGVTPNALNRWLSGHLGTSFETYYLHRSNMQVLEESLRELVDDDFQVLAQSHPERAEAMRIEQ